MKKPASKKKPKHFRPKRSTFVRKVPLRVTAEQARLLDGQSKIANKLYNDLKAEADDLRAQYARARENGNDDRAKAIGAQLYTERGLRDRVPALKADRPYFNAVHSSVLKNAALRLSRAIRSHQKDKAHFGWPGFRRWKNAWFSLEYEEPGKGWSVEAETLHLQFGKDADGNRLGVSVGLVKAPKRVREAKGVRIVKEHGRYFAVFTLEERPVRKRPAGPRATEKGETDAPSCVYIDPNSKNLGYGVGTDGAAFEIDNLPGLRDLDVRIDKLKRKRDRCTKHSQKVEFVRKDGSVHRHWVASRAWRRRDRAVKRLEHVRREWIKQYLFATAHRLFDLYDVVGIGDWSPQNGDHGRGRKANRTLRGRRHLGEFRRVLQWVAEKRGRFAYVLDERGTTRTCNGCGHAVDGGLPPDVRVWTCSSCGVAHHRDENAAENGLDRLLADPGFHQVPGSGRSAIRSRSRWSCRPGGRWVERDWTVPRGHAIKPGRTARDSGPGQAVAANPSANRHAAA